MKKILKTFSLLVALATIYTLGLSTAQAQDAAQADSTKSKLMIGVRAGLNLSYLRIDNENDGSAFAEGAQAGLFVKYAFNDWAAVSLEAAWSQSGARKMKYNSSAGTNGDAFLQLNNVQLNPLVQFKIPVLSVYEPYLFAGPSFNLNYLNSAYINGTNGTNFSKDATAYTTGLDLGLLVGAGVDFNLRFATLTLDARYRHGLNDINQRTGTATQFGTNTWRSSQLSFQVGLGFPIGGK
jgi:hypothetical protein